MTVGTVIGYQRQSGTCALHLIFENDGIGVAEACDQIYVNTHVVQLLCLRQCDGTAQTAADNSSLFDAIEFRRLAQRAYKVMQAVALVHLTQLHGRCADFLHNNRDGALLAVVCRDGQRDTLTVRINAENDELSRLGLLCNIRCINDQQDYV